MERSESILIAMRAQCNAERSAGRCRCTRIRALSFVYVIRAPHALAKDHHNFKLSVVLFFLSNASRHNSR